VDDIVATISHGGTGSTVMEVMDEFGYGEVLEVETNPESAEPTAAISFADVVGFDASCTILSFAVKSEDLTQIFVEVETDGPQPARKQLGFQLEDQIALGDHWYEFFVLPTDLRLNDRDAVSFTIHGPSGSGGSFRITDVRMLKDPWAEPVPASD
jgi:hypothetical protein